MPELYSFQEDAVRRAVQYNSYAFLADPGCGKTAMVINTIKRKLGSFPKTIIFSPKITLRNWQDELKLWAPDEKSVGILLGSPKRRLEIIRENKIIIANYECVRSRDILDALRGFSADVVIADESHRLKNPRAIQTKAVLDISRNTTFRYIMTGTVATNTYLDLFSQYLFLDRGDTFGSNFFVFRGRYFVNKNAAWSGPKAYPDWRFNDAMKEDLIQRVSLKSSYFKKEDVLDLPDLVDQKIYADLSSEQLKHYIEIKDELISWIDSQEDNPMVVQNALTKVLRLNEIINGYMKLADGTIHKFEDNPRLEALEELLEDLAPHKVIIYAIYKENYEDIKRVVKKAYVEIHGSVSDKDRYAAVEAFNDPSSNVRFCIANPRSAGIGINLKQAKYAVYYSRNFSLEEFLQSKARNYRAGSIDIHDKITHYHIIAPGTIDENVFHSLINKNKMIKSLEDIKRML
jgi:SNF2 family DNA or RNA helicase